MDRKYFLKKPFQEAKLARLAAKAVDLFIVIVLSVSIYPLGLVLGIAYLAVCDSLYSGQSVGKRFIGFAVISLDDGRPCSIRQSFIRNLPIIVPLILGLIPILGWILLFVIGIPLILLELYLLFTLDSGLRLGDVMADTSVTSTTGTLIDTPKGRSAKKSWFEEDPSGC